jgi:hypothetical protein
MEKKYVTKFSAQQTFLLKTSTSHISSILQWISLILSEDCAFIVGNEIPNCACGRLTVLKCIYGFFDFSQISFQMPRHFFSWKLQLAISRASFNGSRSYFLRIELMSVPMNARTVRAGIVRYCNVSMSFFSMSEKYSPPSQYFFLLAKEVVSFVSSNQISWDFVTIELDTVAAGARVIRRPAARVRAIRTHRSMTGWISADRRTKSALMLTIPAPTYVVCMWCTASTRWILNLAYAIS